MSFRKAACVNGKMRNLMQQACSLCMAKKIPPDPFPTPSASSFGMTMGIIFYNLTRLTRSIVAL
jgi:hypothetical protein